MIMRQRPGEGMTLLGIRLKGGYCERQVPNNRACAEVAKQIAEELEEEGRQVVEVYKYIFDHTGQSFHNGSLYNASANGAHDESAR